VSVNGESTVNLDLDRVRSMTWGEEGTDVTVEVMRDGEKLSAMLTRSTPPAVAEDSGRM